jgi:hypothetical protein
MHPAGILIMVALTIGKVEATGAPGFWSTLIKKIIAYTTAGGLMVGIDKGLSSDQQAPTIHIHHPPQENDGLVPVMIVISGSTLAVVILVLVVAVIGALCKRQGKKCNNNNTNNQHNCSHATPIRYNNRTQTVEMPDTDE